MKLLAETEIEVNAINWDQLAPTFRRATKNMTLATLACQEILKTLPESVCKNEISVVLGTHFGEVPSTLDFLTGVTASPTLFQNSLHNSTLGFVTVTLGFTGPAVTVSCDRETLPAVQAVAESLLLLTPYTLVCLVDYVPAALKGLYLKNQPFAENHVDKATCSLFARGQ